MRPRLGVTLVLELSSRTKGWVQDFSCTRCVNKEDMLYEGSLGSMTDRLPPSLIIGQSGRGQISADLHP